MINMFLFVYSFLFLPAFSQHTFKGVFKLFHLHVKLRFLRTSFLICNKNLQHFFSKKVSKLQTPVNKSLKQNQNCDDLNRNVLQRPKFGTTWSPGCLGRLGVVALLKQMFQEGGFGVFKASCIPRVVSVSFSQFKM